MGRDRRRPQRLGVLVVSVRTASGSGPGLPTRASVSIPSVPLTVGLVAVAAEAVREGRLSDVIITLGVALFADVD